MDFGTEVLIAFIDVRICDVNQSSYLTRRAVSILKSAENEKEKKYLEPCLLSSEGTLLLLSSLVKVCFSSMKLAEK